MRKTYVMTEEEFSEIKKASESVPYLVIGDMPPMSPQEKVNNFWVDMGKRYGLDWETVKPGSNDHEFTAEEKKEVKNV